MNISSVYHTSYHVYVTRKICSQGQYSSIGGEVGSPHLIVGCLELTSRSLWVFMLLGIEAIKTYRVNPYFTIGTNQIPTWTTPLILALFVTFLIPNTSLLGHLCGIVIGYICECLCFNQIAQSHPLSVGLGYLKFLAPPERILRWLEGKMNLLGRLPHYVSVDQKTYGRYGVLPSTAASSTLASDNVPMSFTGSTQRLGP